MTPEVVIGLAWLAGGMLVGLGATWLLIDLLFGKRPR